MVQLVSFGFKHGLPSNDCDIVDARALRNPHCQPQLRSLTGLDESVQNFIRDTGGNVYEGICKSILLLARQGRNVAVGCYGGRHRSVAMVEIVAAMLAIEGRQVNVLHRDL